jgi:3-oxo-5-alpha-steroid 4-dehydrogenase 1
MSGVLFNLINGYLLASYLSLPSTISLLATSYSRPSFYLGIVLWALGLYGNIWHDEVLLNIRRKAKVKGKAKEGKKEGEYYGIPSGGLYEWVSYPNYFCEWAEWIGWALAAAPLPFAFSTPSIDKISNAASAFISTVTSFSPVNTSISSSTFESFIKLPPPLDLSPPWLFVFSEVLYMFPRAYRGHQWYKDRFEAYPKGRGVVIPGIV